MPPRQTVVVGGGLAGLSCAMDLAEAGTDVLLLEAGEVVGGRTASWIDQGMPVESGLHRFLGYFTGLIGLLERAGVAVDDIVCWEDEIEIRLPDGGPRGVLGLSHYKPVRTLLGLVGNNGLLTPLDLASLVPFLLAGTRDFVRRPDELDRRSVAEFARAHGVTRRAHDHLLVPLTAGIYFLPPERFSAYYFFGLLVPGLPRLHRMRLGAFLGGMTEVMSGPIADAIVARGGEVRTGTRVTGLVVQGGAVVGVDTTEGRVAADEVVVATSITPAQELLGTAFGDHPWFVPLLALPTTPSVTFQVELDAPSMGIDRTVFAPGTAITCFAEQSRTTFTHAPGRVSIILSPPERFRDADPDQLLDLVLDEADRIDLPLRGHVTGHRLIQLPHDFASLEPGHLAGRPSQVTPVRGLSLAGDYTRQRFVTTMEGAVLSGRNAARAVQTSLGVGTAVPS